MYVFQLLKWKNSYFCKKLNIKSNIKSISLEIKKNKILTTVDRKISYLIKKIKHQCNAIYGALYILYIGGLKTRRVSN